ncbi:lysosomal protective protein-like isoform X1 [Tachyglossus aculeatus]|uniref:lysosomal protective protein-like isoform X1 n=1 Tax=Tachyglossus aculeatus TaxID=9261 RepID=UPI0018F7094B|nr:lysosomal protective protein-like isoform X1 [Tachyglossus aculeatus]
MFPPWSLLALSCLRLGFSSSQYAPDLITSLPGLSSMPSFRQWSGYLQAGSGKYFHYWFVESQGNPATDPLVLWLNGGPGCSSMEGILEENGPYRIHSDSFLYENPYSWNKVANILYLESPAGVGYSYSLSRNYQINDQQVAADNYQALQCFFAKFPSFASNDFYVFGESYAGVYIPSLSLRIVDGLAPINFKGFGVGNGVNNYQLNDETLIEFSYYHGIIGANLWASLNAHCCSVGTCNFYNSTESSCFNAILKAFRLIRGIGLNMYSLYSPCWGAQGYQARYASDMASLFREYRFSKANPPAGGPVHGVPKCINSTALYMWMNEDNVRRALHIPSFLPHWELCSSWTTTQYQRQYTDMAPFYRKLLQNNIRVLVYNGDTDMACNFLGGEKFVASLNQPGSGHMVPQHRPAQALKMFESFLKNTSYL